MRTYVKRSRAEAETATREALMDAGTRAFFAGPLGAVSLNAVAAEAGVTKQTLLRHFGSKDGLIAACFERELATVGGQRAQAPAGDLVGIVENLVDHYERYGDRALRLEAAAVSGELPDDFVEAGRKLHHTWVQASFGPWLAALPATVRPARLAALIAVCDVHPWYVLAHHLGLSRREVVAALLATLTGLVAELS